MKKSLSLLLAALMVLCMGVTALAANANDTSFTSEWTDEADDAWATVDDGTNVDVGIKDGVAALVLTGNESAGDHSVGAWYSRASRNARPSIVEIDFSVNEGGYFHARGWNGTNGGYVGFSATGNGGMRFVCNGTYNIAPDTEVTVTADVVHTIRIESIKSNCVAGNYTQGTKYYLDEVLIYSETSGMDFDRLSLCAGKNATVKLYEIRDWGGCGNWGYNGGVTTNFSGKTIAEVEAEGIISSIGTADSNVSAEIVNQTDDAHLALDRVGFTSGGSSALASMIYTLPSPAITEEYNLNIDFMYKGKNAPEIRMCSGNSWFTQMRIYNGKLQISTSGASTYDIKDDTYITPFTSHTLTINGVPNGTNTVFSILLDGRVVAEGLTPISSGHGAQLPSQIQIYSHEQAAANSSTLVTNSYLMGGYYIKSITITEPEAEPDMKPVILDDREIRFDGEGENVTSSMRFKARVTPVQKNAASEYGMIVTRKSILTSLDNAELTFDLENGRYAYGVAYIVDENGEPVLDKIVETDDDGNVVFAAVLTGISNADEAHVNEVFVVRPYVKIADGDKVSYFYGNTAEASLGDVAALVDTSTLDDDRKTNIESIVALVK